MSNIDSPNFRNKLEPKDNPEPKKEAQTQDKPPEEGEKEIPNPAT